MKLLAVLLVSFTVFFVSVGQADEHIGPALKIDDYGGCGVVAADWAYWGTSRVLWSNGNTGHATFKCKLYLTEGDPQFYYTEFCVEDFPLDGGYCCNHIEIEGGVKGMWTGQCFGVWNDGS